VATGALTRPEKGGFGFNAQDRIPMNNNALASDKGNDSQRTFADFSEYRQSINTSDETEPEDDGKPSWNPGSDDHEDDPRHECLNCGASVSQDYIRVMAPSGTENVERCPECSSLSERREGGVTR